MELGSQQVGVDGWGHSHALLLLVNCRPNKKRGTLQVATTLRPQQEKARLSSSLSNSPANEKLSQLSQ